MPEAPFIQQADGTVRQGRSLAPTELPVLEFNDHELTFIRVDHQVRLQFGATEVVIESPFRLLTADADSELDPEDRVHLGPLLDMYPDRLEDVGVEADGELRLRFQSGAEIRVAPDPSFESWQVNGPGTRLVVCSPGGATLAVWT